MDAGIKVDLGPPTLAYRSKSAALFYSREPCTEERRVSPSAMLAICPGSKRAIRDRFAVGQALVKTAGVSALLLSP
jgi:hypothetical protein